MIRKILAYYTEKLEEFIQRDFSQPEGVVEVGFIGNGQEGKKNKLIVSLLSLERETSGGITSTRRGREGRVVQIAPVLSFNLYIIIAAIYDEKRYAESLSVLSSALLFIQSMPSFVHENQTYTIEVVSLSFQELYNIWTSIGGQYYPSVLCKLRRLTFDVDQVTQISGEVNKTIIEM